MEAFIFDMDGVLVDSEPLHEKVKRETLSHFGLPVDAALLRDYIGRSSKDFFAEIVAGAGRSDLSPKMLEDYKHTHYLEVLERDGATPIPGAVDLVHRLLRKGVPLALASSSIRRAIELVLEDFGIEDAFRAVISGAELTASKPNPEIYEKAAAALGVPPAACTALEDAAAGVLAAKRAGMRCIGFKSPHSVGQDLSWADFVVEHLADIDVDRL